MDLSRKWPGRSIVRQALTLLRLLGHWNREFEDYATSNKRIQKLRYLWFRETFYWVIHRKHPDYTRIGR